MKMYLSYTVTHFLFQTVDSLGCPSVPSSNVALSSDAEASQSSTSLEGSASRAIDGNTSSTWTDGSMTHTTSSTDPWWKVKWQNTQNSISMIVVYNRDDGNSAYRARLSNFRLSVLNNGAEVFVYEDQAPIAELVTAIFVDPYVDGDEVKIELSGDDRVLSLAEVEVFGSGSVQDVESLTPLVDQGVNATATLYECEGDCDFDEDCADGFI